MKKILKKFAKQNNIQLLKRFPQSHNLVYLAEQSNKKFILKTYGDISRKDDLENEKQWFEYFAKNPNKLFKVPKLLEAFQFEDTLILKIEYIEGKSFKESYKDRKNHETIAEFFADFSNFIENIEYVPTIRSQKKLNLLQSEVENNFKNSVNKWFEDIKNFEDFKIDQKYLNLIESLVNKANKFSSPLVGVGGLQGSPKFREFIMKNKKIYVLDWEVASSVYVNYYQTASFLSYLAIKMSDNRMFQITLMRRREKERFKKKFDRMFMIVLSHRLVGDIWDLFFVKKHSKRKIEKALGYFERNILGNSFWIKAVSSLKN